MLVLSYPPDPPSQVASASPVYIVTSWNQRSSGELVASCLASDMIASFSGFSTVFRFRAAQADLTQIVGG